MQLKMITTPNPGDVLTPQFFGDKVEIRANMTGKTGSGKLIAEGTPPEYSERWHEYKEYSAQISAPVHATIDLFVQHYGCKDDRDETEQL